MKRITKDPTERRRELIDTAERLFVTNGYDHTAVCDIVKEIKVSQGTFYYYFESKEDALLAVLLKNMDLMENDLLMIAKRDDLDDAIKLNAIFNCLLNIPPSAKVILDFVHLEKNAELHKKVMRSRPYIKIVPIIADVIAKGVSNGRFKVSRPFETSYLLLMLIFSVHKMMYHPNRISIPGNLGNDSEVELQKNMKIAIEEMLSRVLGVHDKPFVLDFKQDNSIKPNVTY